MITIRYDYFGDCRRILLLRTWQKAMMQKVNAVMLSKDVCSLSKSRLVG